MPTVPFQKIMEACKTTGLSQYFLRQGCKDGTIPHIRSGSTYYINVPELLGQLNADGAAATSHDGTADANRHTGTSVRRRGPVKTTKGEYVCL